ncbi:alpha/beta fold hydrolase [Gemmatimonas sp.]|uniref:alpha/beta fold hydrolase n=1 Tax=Gemmatimonas sp. TaxID=1962908 RepID=UPI0027B9C310|nr:alpha/beta fold hydrolase [Gemmatimonas sp.]
MTPPSARHLTVNGTALWVEDAGGDGPPLLFSHGLLMSGRMFDAQVAALQGRYRCIRWDHRGQGRSADVSGRAISIEQVTDDAVALIRALALPPAHFVGLSMGGFVGMRLAARHPELLRSLMLLDTSADAEPAENVPRYRLLNALTRWLGIRWVVGRVMPIMFGRTFLSDPAKAADRAHWRAQLAGNRPSIYRAVNGVVEREAVAPELGKIRCPTLVLVGEEDAATVPAKSERICALIAGADLVRIPGAGHSSSVEQPAAVTAALDAFLHRVDA